MVQWVKLPAWKVGDQGSNFESCVWRAVSSDSSHHPQGVLLTQLSLYVHKGGIKPHSLIFMLIISSLKLR